MHILSVADDLTCFLTVQLKRCFNCLHDMQQEVLAKYKKVSGSLFK